MEGAYERRREADEEWTDLGVADSTSHHGEEGTDGSRARVCDRAVVRRRRRLGEAVRLQPIVRNELQMEKNTHLRDVGIQSFRHLQFELRTQRSCTRDDEAKRRKVVVVDYWLAREEKSDGRDEHADRDLVLLDQRAELEELKLGHHDDTSADVDGPVEDFAARSKRQIEQLERAFLRRRRTRARRCLSGLERLRQLLENEGTLAELTTQGEHRNLSVFVRDVQGHEDAENRLGFAKPSVRKPQTSSDTDSHVVVRRANTLGLPRRARAAQTALASSPSEDLCRRTSSPGTRQCF